MKRRTWILFGVAIVIGIAGALVWQAFNRQEWIRQIGRAENAAWEFNYELSEGRIDHAKPLALTNPGVDELPSVLLLAGTAAVDVALVDKFGESGLLHPLPLDGSINHDAYPRPVETVTLSDKSGRSVNIVRSSLGWQVDIRPFVDESLQLDAAKAMHAELMRLAERIEAGEFATREEALDAYSAAVFIGALKSIGDDPTSLPTTLPTTFPTTFPTTAPATPPAVETDGR